MNSWFDFHLFQVKEMKKSIKGWIPTLMIWENENWDVICIIMKMRISPYWHQWYRGVIRVWPTGSPELLLLFLPLLESKSQRSQKIVKLTEIHVPWINPMVKDGPEFKWDQFYEGSTWIYRFFFLFEVMILMLEIFDRFFQ